MPTSRHVAAQVGDASGLKTFRGRDTLKSVILLSSTERGEQGGVWGGNRANGT